MPPVELPDLDKLSNDNRVRVEERVKEFEGAWSCVDNPDPTNHLPAPDDPLRARVLVELLKRDQLYRWRAGTSLLVEQYLNTWPELAHCWTARCELVESECRERAIISDQFTKDEIAERFPQEAETLRWSNIETLAAVRRHAESLDGYGRFLAIRCLGQGGMGVVFDALDRDRKSRVAVKQLPKVLPGRLYRFKQEFRALADLRHRNLVELYELYSDGGQWLLIMELVHGVDFIEWTRRRGPLGPLVRKADLSGTIEATQSLSEPMAAISGVRDADETVARELPPHAADLPRLRRALRELAEGVDYLHRHGRLHRDLKPANVLVQNNSRVSILDFGLVAELHGDPSQVTDSDSQSQPGSSADYTREGQIVGTARYMAPEQIDGRDIGPAADWYAVGVMLFASLTDHLPFGGRKREILEAKRKFKAPSIDSFVQGAPRDLVQLCESLLQIDPRSRPTGNEIRKLLAGYDQPCQLDRSVRQMPFVGRGEELEQLEDALRTVRAGTPVTMTVHGLSGVGKSSLLSQFLRGLADEEDVVTLSGRCHEQESVPFKAVDSLIDALVRFLLSQDPATLGALLPRDINVLAQMFPVLQSVEAKVPLPPRRRARSDLYELRHLASRALRELFSRLGDRVPLVVVVDDLQWGDVDSAKLLTEVLRPPDAPCMLTLFCFREEYIHTSACLTAIQDSASNAETAGAAWVDMTIDPLLPSEAHELALQLLDSERHHCDQLAQHIATESGGNPYFVIELARFSVEVARTRELPLDDVLWRRFGSLADAPRALVEVVATAGQPIKLRQALDAAGIAHGERHVVAELRANHFLRGSGPGLDDRVEAYHDRIREAVLAKLPQIRRAERHAALAEAMEGSGDFDPETLAIHLSASGQETRAAAFFERAADEAVSTLAFDRAARLYRQCLETKGDTGLNPFDLRVKLADALANAGRGRQAAEVYEQASQMLPQGTERLDLEQRAATQYCLSGHTDQGRSAFRKLMRAHHLYFPSNKLAQILWSLWQRAKLRLRGMSFETRAEDQITAANLRRVDLLWAMSAGLSVPEGVAVAGLQTQGLLLALRAGEPSRLARALACEAILTGSAGWPLEKRCAELIRRARQLAEDHHDARGLGMVELAESMVAMLQMRFRETQTFGEQAERILTERCTGVWWEIATARTLITWSLWHRGEYIELAKRTSQYLNDARTRGDLYTVTNIETVAQAFLRLAQDDVQGAEGLVQRSLEAWGAQGFHLQHLSALYTQVHILLYRGEGRRAYECVMDLWPDLRRSLHLSTQLVRHTTYDLRARASVAAAYETDRPTALLRRARADAERLRRENSPWPRAYSELHLAGVAVRKDLPELARSHLLRAISGFEETGQRFYAAAARCLLGGLVGGEEGRVIGAYGRAVFESQGIRSPQRFAAMHTFGRQ